jgi:acyl carrier protein
MTMDASAIRKALIESLLAVAPEVDPGTIKDEVPLRRQVDLDSMDWLNVILGVHERLGVEIPEADYARLTSVRAFVDYLGAKLG